MNLSPCTEFLLIYLSRLFQESHPEKDENHFLSTISSILLSDSDVPHSDYSTPLTLTVPIALTSLPYS